MNRLTLVFLLLLFTVTCAVFATLSFKEGEYKEGLLWVGTFVAGCLYARGKDTQP